jgi:hypothetical protein
VAAYSNLVLKNAELAIGEKKLDFIRWFLMVLVFARYYGLATTNNRNILKRIFCPVRHDKIMQSTLI